MRQIKNQIQKHPSLPDLIKTWNKEPIQLLHKKLATDQNINKCIKELRKQNKTG